MSFNHYQSQQAGNNQSSPLSGGSGSGSQEFFRFQNVSPEMLNLGFSAGQDLINRQKDKWMPGVSGFWLSLKFYFAVS